MIKSILENRLIDFKWPIQVNGSFIEGAKILNNDDCDSKCWGNKNLNNHLCEHNLSYISKSIGNELVMICGVFIPNEKTPKYLKKSCKLKPRKTSLEFINRWFQLLDEKSKSLAIVIEQQAKKRFDPFHEFVKWANEINHYAERLIRKETFENSSENLKSLYKTSIMLMDSLDTAALYVNPESAAFGRKRSTDLYSMIHKISLVLSHSKSNKNRVNVTFMGRVQNQHKVYESFKVIPLSLIQNAIKYRKCRDIEVVFDERGDKLDFSVVSYGDLITNEEIELIFIRGYRTKKAQHMKVEGTGLGLYALKIVADVHDFEVKVTSSLLNNDQKHIAKNIFTVSIF
jgi:light-regulated signal transduction histidine kinase (bacteriophytochrome)